MTPDAHRPSSSNEDRADARRRDFSLWESARKATTAGCSCEASPGRRLKRAWCLSAGTPASFADLLELGAIDRHDLAVPVSALDLAAGDR